MYILFLVMAEELFEYERARGVFHDSKGHESSLPFDARTFAGTRPVSHLLLCKVKQNHIKVHKGDDSFKRVATGILLRY